MEMYGKLIRVAKIVLAGIVLGFVLLFLERTDFAVVSEQLRKVGVFFYWILFVTVVAYLLGTLSWKVCLGKESSKMSVFQLFAVRQVCETIGLFNPTNVVGGDLLKIYYLKKYGIDGETALSSVVISRMTIMLSQIGLLVLACVWLFCVDRSIGLQANTVIFGVIAILVGAQVGLIRWMGKKQMHVPELAPNGANWVQKVKIKAVTSLHDIRNQYQQDKKMFWISYILALLHWIVGSFELFLILIALGYDVSMMDGLFLDMSIIVFKSFGAFIPGQIGIEELGNKLMLAALGIGSATVWVAVSLLRRARQIVWLAIGLLLYLLIKRFMNHVNTI